MLKIKRHWRTKPDSFIGIDKDHSLAPSGMVLFNEGGDNPLFILKDGRAVKTTQGTAAVWQVDAEGRSLEFAASPVDQYVTIPEASYPLDFPGNTTQPFTIMTAVRFSLSTAAQYNNLLVKGNLGAFNLYENNGIITTGAAVSTTAFSQDEHVVVGHRWDGTTQNAIVKGKLEGSSATVPSTTTGDYILASRSTATTAVSRAFIGRLYWVYFWNRALSIEEIVAITDNPYQILTPRKIYIPVAAAGGTSIAATKQSLLLSEKVASVNAAQSFMATSQSLVLTTYAAGVAIGTNIATAKQSLVVSPKVAAINAASNIAAAKQSLVLTTFTASIDTGTNINATRQALTLSTKVAGINAAVNISATRQSLVLSTYGASVTSGAVSTTYHTSTNKQILITETDTTVPLNISVDDSGGVAGLTITAKLRDTGNASSYFDFADSTFKTSGWAMQAKTLVDYGSGFYGIPLDVSAITNFPAGLHATVEFSVSGSLLAVDSSLLSMSQVWTDSRALTVGKFLGLS